MSGFLEEELHFGGDIFISIESAYGYLVDENAVYQLERLYFYYKGFASESKCWRRLEIDHPYRLNFDQGNGLKNMDN